jgi:hypothetical protein
MLLVNNLELSAIPLVALFKQNSLAVARCAIYSKPTSKVFNPTWRDLTK